MIPPIIEVAYALGLTVKKNGPDKAVIPCPASNHQHDQERPACGIDAVKGVFGCLKCGAAGDAVGLVKMVHECKAGEAYKWLEATFNMSNNGEVARPADPVERLASARRKGAEAFLKLGAADGGKDEVHFPMRSCDGTIKGYRRRRADNQTFGNGPKALTVAGGKNGIIGEWPVPAGDALLTEGEMDAAAGIDAGWQGPVLATPGATPGKPVDEDLQHILAGRTVFMAPDPDQDNDDGRKWRTRIARNLVRAGCKVFIIPAVNDLDLDKRLRSSGDPAGELARLKAGAIPWKDPKPATTVSTVDAELFRLTDLGNAERFKRQHGERVLYDPSTGWRVYDGRRWAADSSGEVHRLAHETARALFTEAAVAKTPDQAQRIGQHAIRTQSRDRLRAMVDVARDLMTVDPKQYDVDPWAYNCQNGTINLKTGELRQHRREDYITQLSPVVYDPAAVHPVFERVINQAMPDEELRHYAKKLFGITLVGEQVDDLFVLMYGPGGTSKTTIIEPFKKLMGDYAATVEPESLMVTGRGSGGAARGDIARLKGVRLALTTEVEDGAKLAVGLVKRMSGGDTITARRIYKDEFEFIAKFTLWIVSNHRPKADSADDGLWRRVKVLPFDHVIPAADRDPKIKATMFNDCLPAFLAWAVEGVRLYLEEGLRTPAAVKAAVEDYRDSQDPLKDFIDACCIIAPRKRIDNTELRKAYLDFCEAEGSRYPLGPKQFGERLRAMGFKPYKIGGTRGFEGLDLTDGTDRTDQADTSITFNYSLSYGKVTGSSVPNVPSVPNQDAQALIDRLAHRGIALKLDDAYRVIIMGHLSDEEKLEFHKLHDAIKQVLLDREETDLYTALASTSASTSTS